MTAITYDGDRDRWNEFLEDSKFSLMEKGLEKVATNKAKRPENYNFIDLDPIPMLIEQEQLNAIRSEEQRKWDELNEKSFAILMKKLHPDIRRGITEIVDRGICSEVIEHLIATYGGEPDVPAIAEYRKKALDTMKDSESIETYINRFEYNNKMAETDMTKKKALLAALTLNLKANRSFEQALDHVRRNQLEYDEAKAFLIREDRAKPSKSRNAKGVVFDDAGKINLIKNDTEKNTKINGPLKKERYESRSRSNSREHDRLRDRSTSPIKRNRNYDRDRDHREKRGRSPSPYRQEKYSKRSDSYDKYTRVDSRDRQRNNRTQKPCFEFDETGKCSFGRDCKYAHEKKDSRDYRVKRNDAVCRYWKDNNCERGSTCRFRHSNK